MVWFALIPLGIITTILTIYCVVCFPLAVCYLVAFIILDTLGVELPIEHMEKAIETILGCMVVAMVDGALIAGVSALWENGKVGE